MLNSNCELCEGFSQFDLEDDSGYSSTPSPSDSPLASTSTFNFAPTTPPAYGQHFYCCNYTGYGYAFVPAPLAEILHGIPLQPQIRPQVQQIYLPSPYTQVVRFWPNLPFGLEEYWITKFAYYFQQYYCVDSHPWSFLPVHEAPLEDKFGKYHVLLDAAKVRFNCEKRGHGWTSMRGLVTFWYRLRRSSTGTVGEVLFKLYGQKCEKCLSRGVSADCFEDPMWYPEEIEKVLLNLRNTVGFAYYGFHRIIGNTGRRQGKPSKPHKSELCQACRDGTCGVKK